MPTYTLYSKSTCPYCMKVERFMERANISLPIKSTLDPANREELIRIGGKPQVPCLVIDGKALYESDDIIDYMARNLATAQ